MLTQIVQVCNYIKQVTYFGLVASYKTGQLLIYALQTLFQILVQINSSIGTVLLVLFEDFSIFLSDVVQRVLHVLAVICDVLQRVANCVVTIVETFKSIVLMVGFCITETYSAIFTAVAKVYIGLGHTLLTVKQFILLLGSGIWFAITLIPLCIFYTFTMFTFYLGCIMDELITIIVSAFTNCKSFFINTYEFVTDVPLESIAGLLTGACIFYVLIKFHIMLYQKVLSALVLIRQNTQRIRLRLASLVVRHRRQTVQQEISVSELSDSSDENTTESDESECNASRLCIICHERRKCMLMLPCRHVCLCNICNERLRNYNRSCPICRGVVQKTMKVFV